MENVGSILTKITEWADEIGSYALVLVAVGTFSMALLEAFKGMFKFRASYHERSLKRWLREDLKQYLDYEKLSSSGLLNNSDGSLDVLANDGLRQVVSLATGVPADRVGSESKPYIVFSINAERSLYTLPLEKMMGQIQESIEIILDNPHLYKPAFILVSGTANKQDVENWFAYRNPEQEAENSQSKNVPSQDMARVGNRIQQAVQRQLDTFQLKTEYLWSRGNQIVSYIIGAVVLFLAIYYSRSAGSDITIDDLPEIVLLSFLGGFAAPIAKDLVSNLRKVKTGE